MVSKVNVTVENATREGGAMLALQPPTPRHEREDAPRQQKDGCSSHEIRLVPAIHVHILHFETKDLNESWRTLVRQTAS